MAEHRKKDDNIPLFPKGVGKLAIAWIAFCTILYFSVDYWPI